MKIFAISDLHLPGSTDDKAMNVFGDKWNDHWNRIRNDWKETVSDEDVILLAGDISWGQTYADVMTDLTEIGEMPGRKILLKGNHDFWWSSISKLRSIVPEGMYAIQNDAVRIGNAVFFGTRGWCKTAKNKNADADNEKIYEREIMRLGMSFDAARKLSDPDTKLYGMAHFPPFSDQKQPDDATEMFCASGARKVVFGHLHAMEPESCDGIRFGDTEFILTACDYLDFRLKLIDEI